MKQIQCMRCHKATFVLSKNEPRLCADCLEAKYDKPKPKERPGCEICGRVGVNLVQDHDHATDEIRGVLCSFCNTALGLFEDNVGRLDSAIIYLVKYRKQPTGIKYDQKTHQIPRVVKGVKVTRTRNRTFSE